jgi:hypothetical protein
VNICIGLKKINGQNEIKIMQNLIMERIDAREKLKITEKEFSNMAFSRGVDNKGIGEIRAKGDEVFESLPPAEDIKKIEAKHRKEMKALQKKQREELDKASKKISQ